MHANCSEGYSRPIHEAEIAAFARLISASRNGEVRHDKSLERTRER